MKILRIQFLLAVLLVQASLAQTTWKEDWRGFSIEEVIKFSQKSGRGGWTFAKLINVFGRPDVAVTPDDFSEREACLIYKLHSGLTFRIIRNKNTNTKRYSDKYFATFELIDPQYDEDEATIWTVNTSRPLTKAEEEEFRAMIEKDGKPFRPLEPEPLPPTDTPPSKLNNKTSLNK